MRGVKAVIVSCAMWAGAAPGLLWYSRFFLAFVAPIERGGRGRSQHHGLSSRGLSSQFLSQPGR